MKLQLHFTITSADDGKKKISKTFSNINQAASKEEMLAFANAYFGLVNAEGLEVYLIKVEQF